MTLSNMTLPTDTARPRRDFLRLLGMGLAAMPAAACSPILKPAALPRLFQLRAPISADLARVLPLGIPPRRLVIALPDAAFGLATQRIVLTRGAYGLDYFADAAWQDKAPAMLQSLLIETFLNTGRLAAVGRGATLWQPDYVLQSDLLDFEAAYPDAGDVAPVIKLRLTASLVHGGRDIADHTDIAEQAPAAHNGIDAVVAAFEATYVAASIRLVAWALPVMARA